MWKIAKKDLKIFFSDRRAMILTLLMPIGLITLFAFAFGGAGGNEENNNPAIILLYTDNDNSSTAKEIISKLDSVKGIEMEKTTVELGEKEIKNGNRIAHLILFKGFEDSLKTGKQIPVELIYDQSRQMEMGMLQSVVIGLFSKLIGNANEDNGIDKMINNMMPMAPPEIKDSVKSQIKKQMAQEEENKNSEIIKMTSIVGDEETSWGLIQAVAGTAVMMLLFSVSAIGAAIIQEKEDGVLRKLLQTPINPYDILFGKMISSTVISYFQLTIMFIYSWLVFGLNLFQNFPALLIMIFITAITCSSFGVLLASIATSKRQVDALRTITILFMSAIGGSMIPLYVMPLFMQHLAVISLNYWSIQGFYDIFWRKLSISAIAENVLVLSCITIFILGIAVYFFKKNILRIV